MTTTGDVTVFGMVMGVHFIEDIAVTVPQGMSVTIPAEQALRSRDLWRAISQKQVFRLHNGPHQTPVVLTPPPVDPVPRLVEENHQLQTALAAQQAQNTAVLKQLQEQHAAVLQQLQTLTSVLAQGVVRPAAVGPTAAPQAPSLDASVPAFIPSTIKPEAVDVHIQASREESEGKDISSTRSKLRQFRQ